jgi:hypothetical protein
MKKIVLLALIALLLGACKKGSAADAAIHEAKANAFAACTIFVQRELDNQSGVRIEDAADWEDDDIVQLGGNFKITMRYPRQGYFLCSVNRVSDEGDWELEDLKYLGLTPP